ncbi:MAG: Flp pilus assembly protein CpaB [Planctomycetaceae bacterium]|nr:Flp pilus assembly protein CpaB [Planctomycetaceae bacterium]
MSARSLLMVVLALVLGSSAAVGVSSIMQGAPRGAVVPVVVAVVDLPRGGSITPEAVKIKEFPKDLIPAGALSKLEDAFNRGIFVPLTKGEPVLESKLAPKGAGRGLAALIPSGMRAYSVKVPDVAQGVAGFILPGNRVDVLLSLGETSGTNETGGGSTITLLQNVEILAVDQKIDAPSDNKVDTKDLRSVTLLVSPQQANQLDLGQNKGMLHLALRNLEDNKAALTKAATLLDLRFRPEKRWEWAKGVLGWLDKAFGQRPPAPPLKAPEPPPTVQIRTIRGVREGVVPIQIPSVSSASQQQVGALGARD